MPGLKDRVQFLLGSQLRDDLEMEGYDLVKWKEIALLDMEQGTP